MPPTASSLGPQPAKYDAEWVRAKYALERDKRLRPDAVGQFIEVTAERLIPLFNRNMGATHLNVQLTETEIALSLITR